MCYFFIPTRPYPKIAYRFTKQFLRSPQTLASPNSPVSKFTPEDRSIGNETEFLQEPGNAYFMVCTNGRLRGKAVFDGWCVMALER